MGEGGRERIVRYSNEYEGKGGRAKRGGGIWKEEGREE